MAVANNSGFKLGKKIWEAACILRGGIDTSEYKHVILGLIFLKYISDTFDVKYKSLSKDPSRSPEDKNEYVDSGIFFVPDCARWNNIAIKSETPEIGSVVDSAMVALEFENQTLIDILPKNYARPEIEKSRLGRVIDLFTEVTFVSSDTEEDLLGSCYEYCLGRFADMEGRLAGEFHTPSSILKILVGITTPTKGMLYDPCCGSGGILVQAQNFAQNNKKKLNTLYLYGQESNHATWKLCKMNLAIQNISADIGEFAADAFFNDLHSNIKADYVLAVPPFNISDWGVDRLLDDKRWYYGIPPTGNGNFGWLQHVIYHMNNTGRAGVVMTNSSLSSKSGGENKIRKEIIEDDLVECVITLPPQMFHTTQIPVSIWFLNRKKKCREKTLFIDARDIDTVPSGSIYQLSDETIKNLCDTFKKFEQGRLKNKLGFCAVASIEDIANQDYVLVPGRYVGFVEEQENESDFANRMNSLTVELSVLFEKSHMLENEIRERLGAIGYEF